MLVKGEHNATGKKREYKKYAKSERHIKTKESVCGKAESGKIKNLA